MAAAPRNYDQNPTNIREIPLEEISELLSDEEMLEINLYQLGLKKDFNKLLQQPLPPQLENRNPLGWAALRGNTMWYEEDMEDQIVSDQIVEELLTMPNTAERAETLRSRRTVVAFLIKHGIDTEETSAEAAAPQTQDGNTVEQNEQSAA